MMATGRDRPCIYDGLHGLLFLSAEQGQGEILAASHLPICHNHEDVVASCSSTSSRRQCSDAKKDEEAQFGSSCCHWRVQ